MLVRQTVSAAHLCNLLLNRICCTDLSYRSDNLIAEAVVTPDIQCAAKWGLYCKCFTISLPKMEMKDTDKRMKIAYDGTHNIHCH